MTRSMMILVRAALAAAGALLAVAGFAHDGKMSFAPVLKEVTPAVVNIQVSGERAARHPLFNDPAFRRFFRFRSEPEAPIGAGSGVIIDADKGYVVTNHHVIDGADKITVGLNDQREFAAELVGSDPQTDIALLRIDGDDLAEVPFGDSDGLEVGDFVIAIGNPFDLGQTVTSGIVSALGRGVDRRGDSYEDFIQTDAAINRGNSGGALVDLDGRLVGINSVIVSPSGANAGVGFAVPTHMVKVVTDQLLEYGDVRRGYLGVGIADVEPEQAELLGLAKASGAIVTEVTADSAAIRAGVEPDDVIVGVNGNEVVDVRDLRAQIGLTPVGEEVDLSVVRDGKRIELSATIGDRPGTRAVPAYDVPELAGALFRDFPEGHVLLPSRRGVEVAKIEPGSPAYQYRLFPGDVILMVNDEHITSLSEFQSVVADAQALVLRYLRASCIGESSYAGRECMGDIVVR